MNTDSNLLFFLHSDNFLATEVSRLMNLPISGCKVSHFADGEVFAKPLCSVKEKTCFIVQSTCRPANDRLMELLVFIDALKNGGAEKVHLIVPYYGYARQERQIDENDPISARLVAKMIETSGADSFATTDIHTTKILNFFDKIKATNLACAPLFGFYFKDHAEKSGFQNKDVAIVSPDHGGVKRAMEFLNYFPGASLAVADKHRPRPNRAEILGLEGDVHNKLCIVIDDMIDTAGTVVAVSKLLYEEGAKAVFVGASHGIFSGNAVPNLLNVGVKEIVVTDSIENKMDGVTMVSLAPLLADYMKTLSD